MQSLHRLPARWGASRLLLTLGIALAVLTAIGLVGINEMGYRQSGQALAEIGQAQKMRDLLNALLQSILDAETGQRGYLLTGDARYRTPYDAALQPIDGDLAELLSIYADRPEENRRLIDLNDHVRRKLAEMDMSVRMRQSGNDDAWKFVLTTDVGREEMNTIRRLSGELMTLSNASLAQAHTQVAATQRMARVGIGSAALVALLAFALYLRQSHRLHRVGEREQRTLENERNRLEKEVRERTATLTELATHLQDVRETECGFLARELHDELGALLTAAKLDVARLRSRLAGLADAPELIARLTHLTELLNSGIALKRRIIEDLRPSALDNLGLAASLEILGREFAERSGVHVEMVLESVTLDEARQLTIYRLVQESLTNIGKYAQAQEATVVLKNYGNHVVLEVADNGQGFDPLHLRPATHGLAGMRHRVEATGGKFSIRSTPDQGTTLTALLPVASPHPTRTMGEAPTSPIPQR